MTMPHGFSEADIHTLRAHGIALFAGRVIFDAQPPMAEDAIAAVQAHCVGPLPPALLALWRQTAGGRLDYHLSLEVDTSEGRPSRPWPGAASSTNPPSAGCYP